MADDGTEDGFAYELGTGGICRNDNQNDLQAFLSLTSQITHAELQSACAPEIGPMAHSVPDAITMARLIKPARIATLIDSHVRARRPVRLVRKNDAHGRAGAARTIRIANKAQQKAQQKVGKSRSMAMHQMGALDFEGADVVDGGPNVSGKESDASSGGPPPGMYFKPDADGGKFVPLPSGWPPAASYRPGNWDFDASNYALAFGDTLSGLAITYLGSPQRWKEIWDANPQDWRWSHKPDTLMAGTKIVMPFEARDRAKKMLAAPPAGTAPSTIGKQAPIPVAGEDKNAPVVNGGTAAAAASKGKKYLPYAAAGAAVLAVGYFALR